MKRMKRINTDNPTKSFEMLVPAAITNTVLSVFIRFIRFIRVPKVYSPQ